MTSSSLHPPIALTVAQKSGIGARSTNQDYLAWTRRNGLACFVVADGAGGHEGGEIASRVVTQTIVDCFRQASSCTSALLDSCIELATASLGRQQAVDRRFKDMTTTIALLFIDLRNRRAMWTHLGDTRIYLFRRNRIISITRDHSLVQQFVDAGYCKPDQLRMHPQRSRLYAAIGADNDTVCVAPHGSTDIEDGDTFLVCTDGFWEWVTEHNMEVTLSMATSADEWLASMMRHVESQGGQSENTQDNFSAFAIWIGEPNEVTVRR